MEKAARDKYMHALARYTTVKDQHAELVAQVVEGDLLSVRCADEERQRAADKHEISAVFEVPASSKATWRMAMAFFIFVPAPQGLYL